MAGSGGAGDHGAHSADPLRAGDRTVDASASPSDNPDSLQSDWEQLQSDVDEVNEGLTGLTSGRAAEVPELRDEVKKLGEKVDGLNEAITKLRETFEKAERMEGEAWNRNNQLLDDLYDEVVREREWRETPGQNRRRAKGVRTRTAEESGDDMSAAGFPPGARTKLKKSADIVRKLLCG